MSSHSLDHLSFLVSLFLHYFLPLCQIGIFWCTTLILCHFLYYKLLVIFLVAALWITINILIYSSQVQINTILISTIHKNGFLYRSAPSLSPLCYCHTNYIFTHYITINSDYCFVQLHFKSDRRGKTR